jgi:hypothetical protein
MATIVGIKVNMVIPITLISVIIFP